MKTTERQRLRLNRKRRVKANIKKGSDRLRLTVFKSTKHIYAQIINDKDGKTLVSESTMSPAFKEKMQYGGNVKAASRVGELIGEKAKNEGINEIFYDRNGFIYAGRVKALADAVREKGIKF